MPTSEHIKSLAGFAANAALPISVTGFFAIDRMLPSGAIFTPLRLV
jgi:hypothetical protein